VLISLAQKHSQEQLVDGCGKAQQMRSTGIPRERRLRLQPRSAPEVLQLARIWGFHLQLCSRGVGSARPGATPGLQPSAGAGFGSLQQGKVGFPAHHQTQKAIISICTKLHLEPPQ